MAAKKTTRKRTRKTKTVKAKVVKTNSRKALVRKEKGKMIAGVGLALSDYFDVDVTMVRILIVFFSVILGFGPGVVLYLLAWILIPSE